MFLLEAVWAARHQLQSAYQTRNFISVTIFVLICMLGLFILCAIWIMQSESKRSTQHQERDRRRMENNRRASNFGSGIGKASPLSHALCPGLLVPETQDCVLLLR